MLREFREADGTDYLALLIPFREFKTAMAREDGVLTSWLADRLGGFTE